jgi:hypothetical protein
VGLCFAKIQKNIFFWIFTRKSPERSGPLSRLAFWALPVSLPLLAEEMLVPNLRCRIPGTLENTVKKIYFSSQEEKQTFL